MTRSQAAIPLATITAEWFDSLYDLMDGVYDAVEVYVYSRALEHKPIIDKNLRSKKPRIALRKRRKERWVDSS